MYEITQDPLYINYIQHKNNISKNTKMLIKQSLTKLTKALNLTLTEIVQNCKEQQNKIIEKITRMETKDNEQIIEKTIIKFDVNSPESLVKQYLNKFIEYCKARKNKNITINKNLSNILAFLSFNKIQIPNMKKLEQTPPKWYLLTKEDFNYVIKDSTIHYQALIVFLLSTGMRIQDALQLRIKDFMKATSNYHNCIDAAEFIDTAPENMIGSWKFNPSKTMKHGIKCHTFNSPESSNIILQNLRRIKNDYNPAKNAKSNLNLEVSKNDYLFGSKSSYFKGPMNGNVVADQFRIKNDKLYAFHVKRIKEKIKNNELSSEDYYEEINKIPRFHAHGCRKYFESMISHNCGDLRICTLLEGHASPIKTDSSYIKLNDNDVYEAYLAALPDLSLENTETKVYTSEARREMEEKIAVLEKELESKTNEVETVNNRVDSIEKILGDLGIENIVDKVKKE